MKRGMTAGVLNGTQSGNGSETIQHAKRRKTTGAEIDGKMPFTNPPVLLSNELSYQKFPLSYDPVVPQRPEIIDPSSYVESLPPTDQPSLHILSTTQENFSKVSPGRSKSSQLILGSPHDTEPMSSNAFQRAYRTLTSVDWSQPSVNTYDELSLPPSVDASVSHMAMSTKANKEKKESTPINPDISFLGHSQNYLQSSNPMHEPLPSINSSMSYQDVLGSNDSGRVPREMYITHLSHSPNGNATSSHHADISEARDNLREDLENAAETAPERLNAEVVVPEVLTTIDYQELNEPVEEPTPSLNAPVANGPNLFAGFEANQLEAVAIPREPEPVTERSKLNQKEANTKKKKVKRGKTMSAAMHKKAVDSDIEDDVIWVDEKPPNITFKDELPQLNNTGHMPPNGQREMEAEAAANPVFKRKKSDNDAHLQLEPERAPQPQPPASKKRGRPRKKATNGTDPETNPNVTEKQAQGAAQAAGPIVPDQNVPDNSKPQPLAPVLARTQAPPVHDSEMRIQPSEPMTVPTPSPRPQSPLSAVASAEAKPKGQIKGKAGFTDNNDSATPIDQPPLQSATPATAHAETKKAKSRSKSKTDESISPADNHQAAAPAAAAAAVSEPLLPAPPTLPNPNQTVEAPEQSDPGNQDGSPDNMNKRYVPENTGGADKPEEINKQKINRLENSSNSINGDKQHQRQRSHDKHSETLSLNKGPNKHSPISINRRIPVRVGLSKSIKIAPLLSVVRKTKRVEDR